MVFFAQKVLRQVPGNWTFVVVTDRVELDGRIAKTFKAPGAVSEAEGGQCHAASGAHLRELLRGNHRSVFTRSAKVAGSLRTSQSQLNFVGVCSENHRSNERHPELTPNES